MYRACAARTSGHVQDPEDGVGEDSDGDTVRSNIAEKHVQPISVRLLYWKVNIHHVSTNERQRMVYLPTRIEGFDAW